ncbi:MAG: hypothetical protein B7Z66_08755 [Chromatiales bacterium 21-64-14]|nr:MAG: hypothetical protein B7Z66_08755 [Chromatiales bacterium 21-64-14]HQU16131.1 SPOR domain-containing protein [Gammaproteobacteria bacterium]
MPRDYKHSANRKQPQPAPGWVWLVAGLALGLFVALLVFLRQYQPATAVRTTRSVATTRSAAQTPKPEAKKPALNKEATSAKEPKFDFYTILPEMEVMVPDQDISGKVEHGVTQVAAPGTYILQAGSFRKYQQADRLKAQLALLGLEADIQSVTVSGTETWHRVRLGPFRNLKKLNETREVLKEHHIEALLLKLKS